MFFVKEKLVTPVFFDRHRDTVLSSRSIV
jgi:hypothetical protein